MTMKELLEAGVHFGHQKRKWNPKMGKFIFGDRSGIYIIDLEKTLEGLKSACSFLEESSAAGKIVLFVGTKKQAVESVSSEAARCGMLHVTRRWLGGTLTNFETLRGRIKKLRELESIEEDAPSRLTKKELLVLKRERERLQRNLSGLRDMKSVPGVLVVVDPHREKIAVAEANKMGIPIVAIADTNANPDLVQYCIPANDDAIRSIKVLVSKMADAVIEGKRKTVRVFEEKESGEKKETAEEPAEEPVKQDAETPEQEEPEKPQEEAGTTETAKEKEEK
jgi:small subunit ribosomal protein S2